MWQRSNTMNEYERFMLEQNKIMSRWCILVHNKKLWTIILGTTGSPKQNKDEFLFWLPRLRIFRITRGYLLHSLIFPHSLRIFKDFGTQITNTAVFVKIFIFQKWILFPIWWSGILHNVCMPGKLTRCVTCKVYLNGHVPRLRAQQKMMQSQIYEIFIVDRY